MKRNPKMKSKSFKKRPARSLTPGQKAEVKSIIRRDQELKLFDLAQNAATVSTAGFIAGLADLFQGTAQNQRIGDSVQLCGNLECRFQMLNSTGDAYNHIRFIIFQWHPISIPTIGDILAVGPFGGSYDYLSNYNFNARQQYKILYDKTTKTTLPTATDFQFEQVQTWQARVPLKKVTKLCQYKGVGSAQATNRLYFIQLSDSLAPGHPSLSFTIRSFFRDS